MSQLHIHTLRTTADDCGENKVCPSVHAVTGREHVLYVVSKTCADPAETAAFAADLEPGEVLGWMPAGFLPAGSDALRRTRNVTGDGVRPDRQYVISSVVTDRGDLDAFGHLFDPETEQLGTVPARQLQGCDR